MMSPTPGEASKSNAKKAMRSQTSTAAAAAATTTVLPNDYRQPFLGVPLFSILFNPIAALIAPIWSACCAIRWAVSRPLNTPVMPKWIPNCFPGIPLLKRIPYISFGELLFLIPIVVIILASVNLTIWNKEVEESGSICNLPLLAVFLTANKSNSLITFALGVPFERMILWHALWSLCTLTTVGLHLYCAFFEGETDDRRRLLSSDDDFSLVEYDAENERYLSGDGGGGGDSIYGLNGANPDLVKFAFDSDTNKTGTISFLAMVGLVVFSMVPAFRRWAFELWYIPHIAGALVAAIFAAIHGAGLVLIVLGWWAVDLTTRYVLMAGMFYPHKASLRLLPGDIVEISFPKPNSMHYEAGQYIMISIPMLSFSQFHPFTVSSSPHQSKVTLHIKAIGRWTRRLKDLAKTQSEVSFLMEGPYGQLMMDLENQERYKMMLLVSGGIGCTPMYSIANDLLHKGQCKQRDIKKLKFVWALRSIDMVQALSEGDNIFDNKKTADFLDVDIYLTKNSGGEEGENLSFMKNGRPNIDEIFEEMKQAAIAEGESHVAVCVCGPSRLIDMCREASRRYSDGLCKGGVTFDFHEETFMF